MDVLAQLNKLVARRATGKSGGKGAAEDSPEQKLQ
jgi:hypothetical protein